MNESIQAYDNVLQLVGNTPLVKLRKVVSGLQGNFYAKLECFNPGHSAKDRIAKYIIEQAEAKCILKPGSTIVETTSGNTGFSIAMASMVKGYKCILAVSSKSSPDKIDILKSMGAQVYVCPAHVAPEDPRSYYEVAKRIHKETPNSIYINQYFNELNIEAHYLSTGKEIWGANEWIDNTSRCLQWYRRNYFRYCKIPERKNPNIKILAVDAFGSALQKYHETGTFDQNEVYPYRIEGLGKNLIPKATDFTVIDRYMKVTDAESAHMARRIATEEGMFLGYTSGAALQAAHQYHTEGEFQSDSNIVVIFLITDLDTSVRCTAISGWKIKAFRRRKSCRDQKGLIHRIKMKKGLWFVLKNWKNL